MAARTNLKLTPVDKSIVVEALIDELRGMAEATREALSTSPYEPYQISDVRWKVERMQAIIDALTRIGFAEKPVNDTYAGTSFDANGALVIRASAEAVLS